MSSALCNKCGHAMRLRRWKASLVVAFVLATMGVSPLAAEPVQVEVASGYNQSAGLTEGHIAQAKAALRLTPAQERHWPRVAAALRAIGRQSKPLLRTLNAEQKHTAMAMVQSVGYGHLAPRP